MRMKSEAGQDRIVSSISVNELAERLRRKDPTLWGDPGTPELADRLGWIDLPQTMSPHLDDLKAIAADAIADNTDHVVLLGMGGSSLAPEVFSNVLGIAPGHPGVTVLDSTHPDQVRAVAESIDPSHTIFVVSSKSGSTLETLSAFRLFWRTTGGNGRRFIAITDEGTSLARLGSERGFRAVISAPSDVGGRFSALTPFGLLPAALIGADLDALLEAAASASFEDAVEMGIAWGESALSGRDKLTFLTSPGLRAFPIWMEQLVAESLGKEGKGIIPVAGEPPLDRYDSDRLFVEYRLAGEPAPVSPSGHSIITRSVENADGVAAEMMAAEVATAVAGIGLKVNPFDQPDVELAKQRARQALDADPARVDLVDFFSPVLADLIDDLLASIRSGDYFAIQAYLPSGPEVDSTLSALRHKIGNRSGMATTSGYGPRFLHSTGQLHKGGSNNGVFLQLVDTPLADLEIPETDTTFGTVVAAQALGDYLALKERDRRILRVDLGPNRQKGLQALLAAIG
jgi:transaldolase/glucose-6-phosphate isomerase